MAAPYLAYSATMAFERSTLRFRPRALPNLCSGYTLKSAQSRPLCSAQNASVAVAGWIWLAYRVKNWKA